jgi:hypothetical protein
MWRAGGSELRGYPDIRKLIGAEIERDGDRWPYLKAGLFGGSIQRLKETKEAFDKDLETIIQRMRHGMH